jgi:hypothetical protein
MAVKLGTPALLLFIWYLITIFRLSVQGAKQEEDLKMRATYAAISAGIIGIFVSSITEPHIMADTGLAYIAVLAGLTIAMRRQANFNLKIKLTKQFSKTKQPDLGTLTGTPDHV